MDPRTAMTRALDRADRRLHAELVAECRHPMSEYQQGSPRLEKLIKDMELANKYQQPDTLTFNL